MLESRTPPLTERPSDTMNTFSNPGSYFYNMDEVGFMAGKPLFAYEEPKIRPSHADMPSLLVGSLTRAEWEDIRVASMKNKQNGQEKSN